MEAGRRWTRRGFLAGVGVVAGLSAGARRALSSIGPVLGVPPLTTANPYEELGVKAVVNAQGTMTYLGGSLIRPEVEAVMCAAAKHYVNIVDLHVAAGARIAQMLKLPEDYTAYVTSGAAGAIVSGTAAVITGNNPEFIERIPDLTGMKSEVIIQKSHRYPFDHQIRCCGIKLVEVETPDELRKAVCDKTALLFFTNYLNSAGRIKVDEFARLAKELRIPSFNDAAADTPPVSRLTEYVSMGYDMVTFSGGKAIRGPQCAGLLLGRKGIIGNAILNTSPYEDTLCRAQKVGKEEIVGMVKALELYLEDDHEALTREWWRRLDQIAAQLKRLDGVSTAYHVPEIANHVPSMQVFWDPRKYSLAPADAAKFLLAGQPSIAVGQGREGLSLTAFMLQPGEEKIVAAGLERMFRAHTV